MGFTEIPAGISGWDVPLNKALADLQDQVVDLTADVNKNKHWRNVRDYGAVGDGIADDTAAVQATINAGTGPVYFPPGTYLCSTLQMLVGTVLLGAQQSNYSFPTPAARASTLKLKGGTNSHLIQGAAGIANVQIRNLGLDGNKANNTAGDLIHLDAATAQDTAWHITDCFLNNAPFDGIQIGSGRQALKVQRTWIMQSAHNGVTVNGADTGLDTCLIGLSGGDGVNIGGLGWVIHMSDCDIWSSTGGGVVIGNGVTMVSLVGCGIDRNKKHGLFIGDTVNGVTATSCHFHSNSQQTNAGFPNIQMSSSGELTVTGCNFGNDSLTNMPSHNIEVYNGTLHASANINITGSQRNGHLYIDPAAQSRWNVDGDVAVTALGKGLRIKEGTGAKSGVVTLVGGTATVANSSITATSRIQLTGQADGGTPGWYRVSARTAGTSFTVTSSSPTDTSQVGWFIVEQG